LAGKEVGLQYIAYIASLRENGGGRVAIKSPLESFGQSLPSTV